MPKQINTLGFQVDDWPANLVWAGIFTCLSYSVLPILLCKFAWVEVLIQYLGQVPSIRSKTSCTRSWQILQALAQDLTRWVQLALGQVHSGYIVQYTDRHYKMVGGSEISVCVLVNQRYIFTVALQFRTHFMNGVGVFTWNNMQSNFT